MNNWRIKYQIAVFNIEMRLRYRLEILGQFWSCLKEWLAERPRKIACDFCGEKMWIYGRQDCPIYCNEYCAFYGTDNDDDSDIPF